MDYCGVEYTAVEAVGSSSWKWRIFISNEVGMKISGEAVSQAAAIAQASSTDMARNPELVLRTTTRLRGCNLRNSG